VNHIDCHHRNTSFSRAASLDANTHYGNFSVGGNPTTTPIDQASFPDWNGGGGTTSHMLGGNQSPMP
jgi:hypothetical protein